MSTRAGHLTTATWREVDSLDRRTLVVPLGSTEQHGAHLPLSTDTIIAEAVACAITDEYEHAALAPTIAIAASGEHAGFAGTLSVGTEALYNYLLELVRHSVPGWSRMMIVNGHGGNAAALSNLAATCAYERRPILVHHCHSPGADAHAGRTETSLLLHLRPELVRLDRAAPGNTRNISELLPAMHEGGVRAVSPNGILGDPTGASAAEGAQLFTALVEAANETYLSTPGAVG